MDLLEKEDNKESIITLEDFPFICRICCSKGRDLRLFEAEGYLLDLFNDIRKIDVSPGTEFPKNICNECVNQLEDISLFIDISKYHDASFGRDMRMKGEINDYTDDNPSGISSKSVGIIEEKENDMLHERSQICRICSSSACISLTPLEEKPHLMQLFQNITNIDVSGEFKTSSICNKCNNELENISSFLSSSLSNEQKLDRAIDRKNIVKTEIDSILNNTEFSKFRESKPGKVIDMNSTMTDNTCNKNSPFTVSKVELEIIDIKEENIESKLASSIERNYQDGLKFHSRSCLDGKLLKSSPIKEAFLCMRKCDDEVKLITPSGKKSDKKSDLQCMLIHKRKKSFDCDSCDKSFSVKGSLQRHTLTHTGERPFKCDRCGKCYRRKSDLQHHMLPRNEARSFRCFSCDRSFARKTHLKQHMQTHSREKPFRCDCCDKQFTRKNHLRRHFITHSARKQFKCDDCGRSFVHKKNLLNHMLGHAGEKKFKCDLCEKSFLHKQSLRHHMVAHNGGEPFKCDRCEKSFALERNLRRHLVNHSAKNRFKCDYCEKRYTWKYHLRRHVRTHTAEKPFKCDCCDEQFLLKRSLKQHMHTHAGRDTFECYCCGKRFSWKRGLQHHIMLNHTGGKLSRDDSSKEISTQK